MTTKIEWTDAVWNPTTGCSKISEGCANCYAERMAKRLRAMKKPGYAAVVDESGWTGQVCCRPEKLAEPLGWRKPRQVFVDSMSDLFHKEVPETFIRRVWKKMWAADRHTYQILTKRVERAHGILATEFMRLGNRINKGSHIWLGTSVELQEHADRIGTLLQVPAAVHFLSLEPLLGPVVFDINWLVPPCPGCGRHEPYCDCDLHGEWPIPPTLNWVILGCESKGGRLGRLSVDGTATEADWWGWVRDIKNQCVTAGIPLFIKQGPVEGRLVSEPELDGRKWLQKPNQ